MSSNRSNFKPQQAHCPSRSELKIHRVVHDKRGRLSRCKCVCVACNKIAAMKTKHADKEPSNQQCPKSEDSNALEELWYPKRLN
jgi:hypothetical protein